MTFGDATFTVRSSISRTDDVWTILLAYPAGLGREQQGPNRTVQERAGRRVSFCGGEDDAPLWVRLGAIRLLDMHVVRRTALSMD